LSVKDQMQVVIAGSRNLYPWFPYAYMSLLDHNPNAKVWIFIEDEKLPYDVPEQVETVDISKQTAFGTDGANWKTTYTYMSLMRSTYPLLFTGESNALGVRELPRLNRVIQLDVDVIVNDTLTPIWSIDMKDAYFAMTEETLGSYFPFGNKDENGKRKPYYNCAVAVFDLENMRRDGIAEEEIAWLNNTRAQCIDQDAHMYICERHGYDKCLTLGPRYNECFATQGSLRPAVVHAAGVRRWWDNLEEQYRGAYWQKYEKYTMEPYRKCVEAGIKC